MVTPDSRAQYAQRLSKKHLIIFNEFLDTTRNDCYFKLEEKNLTNQRTMHFLYQRIDQSSVHLALRFLWAMPEDRMNFVRSLEDFLKGFLAKIMSDFSISQCIADRSGYYLRPVTGLGAFGWKHFKNAQQFNRPDAIVVPMEWRTWLGWQCGSVAVKAFPGERDLIARRPERMPTGPYREAI